MHRIISRISIALIVVTATACGPSPLDDDEAPPPQHSVTAGWQSIARGLVEKTTAQGGVLRIAYSPAGIAELRRQLATELDRRASIPAHTEEERTQLAGLRRLIAESEPYARASNAAQQDWPTTDDCAVSARASGTDTCGCDGEDPYFKVTASAEWASCIDLDAEVRASIAGIQDISAKTGSSGAITALRQESGVPGTRIYGMRNSIISRYNSDTGISVISQQSATMISCTLPKRCAWPKPEPAPLTP